MKLSNIILLLCISVLIYGQNNTFYKTTGKRNLHYLEFNNEKVIVYKMGFYFDKGGASSAIILTDTLLKNIDSNFKGKIYSLLKTDSSYFLITDKNKKLETKLENNNDKVNTELNNAYCIKSYFELSHKLNTEYPLYHYTHRNAYSAWNDKTNKAINHNDFALQTDKEIKLVYDSISLKQHTFSKTTDFITSNIGQITYSTLRDSLKTLPIDWRPQVGYFDKVVYQMSKSNSEYFYNLLQDFPTSKTFIYYAVNNDKELVKQIKQVQGYDDLKKEFFKDYKFGRTMGYRIIGTYAVAAGLLTWLFIAQP